MFNFCYYNDKLGDFMNLLKKLANKPRKKNINLLFCVRI